jgi:hypothetical protein
MTDSLTTFRFDGDALPSRVDTDGLWIEFGPLCKAFSKDLSNQLKALKDEPWAKLVKFTSNRSGPGRKAKTYLHADSVHGWIFTLQTTGMPAELVAKINRYKIGSAKALRDFWVEGYALNPNATAEQRAKSVPAWMRWIADTIQSHPALWTGQLIDELARLWGVPPKFDKAGGFSVGLIAAVRFCYETACGADFYRKMREVTGRGEGRAKRYKALTKEGYDLVAREKGRWEMLATICRTKAEFIDKMLHFYAGQPMQTGFW